jgi:hypothetical protein
VEWLGKALLKLQSVLRMSQDIIIDEQTLEFIKHSWITGAYLLIEKPSNKLAKQLNL